MIEHPNAYDDPRALAVEDDDADVGSTPAIKIRRLKYNDPDAVVEKMARVIDTKIVGLDAKVVTMKHGRPVRHGELVESTHFRSWSDYLRHPQTVRRLRDTMTDSQLREAGDAISELVPRRLRENFAQGLYGDETSSRSTVLFPVQETVLPAFNNPASKQMLLMDVLDMHAKCLSGDTPIPLLDGSTPTIAQLADRGRDAEFWVYANDAGGNVVPARARSARQTGVKPIFAVTLDNGEVVRATANHPFMLRDGTYRHVEGLKPNDRLMPLYRRDRHRGYEEVYHPGLDLWELTHHLVARVTKPQFRDWESWDHIDHIDETRTNNNPENLQLLTKSAHFKKTAAHPARRAFAVQLGKRQRTPGDLAKQRERQLASWANPEHRERRLAGWRKAWADPEKRTRMQRGLSAAPNRQNHSVVSVEPCGEAAVYDITVPGYENFAVGQGVFVHNSWEAGTRNPIGKRITRIIPQFVMGRGVKGSSTDARLNSEWTSFARRNNLKLRLKNTVRELVMFGEVFNRFFRRPEGLVQRSLDPSTIWDIVTNPDDIEDVHYYHQQFVVANQMPLSIRPGQLAPTASTLVIRQIPADEIDHFKINATSSEKRGRSELYAILGWLLRFKEFCNDRVVLNKMRAMFALDVAVDGDASQLSAAEQQFARPLGPGAVLIHNKAVTVDFKNANNNANEAKTDAEMFLKIIAVGAGVSEQFLGVSYNSTRAGALISTEPDVKNFEDYREIVEEMLMRAADRVAKNAGIGASATMEFSFPSLAGEERSAKIKDLAFAEAMDWFTKERAATMAAREFDITNYDFRRESRDIGDERAANPVIAQGLQQMPKIAQDPLASDTPGLGGDLKKAPKTGERLAHASASMGLPSDIGGRGLPNTKATLDRGSFSRGAERVSIQNQRSAGAPLRQSAVGDPGGAITAGVDLPTAGWGKMARMRSLLTRKRRRFDRLMQEGKAAEAEALRTEITLLESETGAAKSHAE